MCYAGSKTWFAGESHLGFCNLGRLIQTNGQCWLASIYQTVAQRARHDDLAHRLSHPIGPATSRLAMTSVAI